MMYTDLWGLEKILIFVGAEKTIGEFKDIADYYKKKFLAQGIKESNILINQGVTSVEEFNKLTAEHKDNIGSITWITHAQQDGIGINGSAVNSSNISQINAINTKPMSTNKGNITIVGCNAGRGENSIASQLSNQTGVPVTAATFYIFPITPPPQNPDNDVIQNTFNSIGPYITYGTLRFFYERGETVFPLTIGEWKTYTPN